MNNLAAPGARTGSDFAQLSHRINDLGLLDRRPAHYAVRLTTVAALLSLGWAAFFLVGESWWQLAVAGFLAIVFGQIALVAHDLAHRQVFRTKTPSAIAGRIAGNLLVGMSYGWWMDKHTRHHANPNHEGLDPDVEPDVLVWSAEQARASRGLPRFIGRWQAVLFFPLLTLQGWNMHFSSFRAVFGGRTKSGSLEAGLLLAHFALYLGAIFVVLPPVSALAFIITHQALWGIYLGSIFAPNHKGMPTFRGDERPDFLRRQVLTSRNVRGGHLVDIALGGLNHQIEHHLFPSMPSPNLREAAPVVRAYCAEIGVPYHETGLLDSYRQTLSHLHEAGAPIRAAR